MILSCATSIRFDFRHPQCVVQMSRPSNLHEKIWLEVMTLAIVTHEIRPLGGFWRRTWTTREKERVSSSLGRSKFQNLISSPHVQSVISIRIYRGYNLVSRYLQLLFLTPKACLRINWIPKITFRSFETIFRHWNCFLSWQGNFIQNPQPDPQQTPRSQIIKICMGILYIETAKTVTMHINTHFCVHSS